MAKTSEEIREIFYDFWKNSVPNFKEIPNESLVPNNDSTLLFVNCGMFPLVPYLAGQPHPQGKRLFNIQRSIRTIDIDEVGDNRHLTLFEMIGDWSLGDFTKENQIPWLMELYVEKFGLDPHRLYGTVWAGDDAVPQDDVAIETWKKAFKKYGIKAEFTKDITQIPQSLEEGKEWPYRIFPYGKSDNWWSRGVMVEGELGGPSAEIFYDLGVKEREQDKYHINDDSGRFLEIGNNVFMEYKLDKDLKWQELEQKNIDFGGGLERVMVAVQGVNDVFATDLFKPYIKFVEEISGQKYTPSVEITPITKAFRVIAEHGRAATFILGDRVLPSNKDQGYILRRLIRRMVRYGMKLGIKDDFTSLIGEQVIVKMKDIYPHLEENKEKILDGFNTEENKFKTTLKKGLKEIEKIKESGQQIDGKQMFHIYETYGFPPELTLEELAIEENDRNRFMKEFNKAQEDHKSLSRAGSKQKFQGGLADQSGETTKLHTTQHLLLKALQTVLGDSVKQKGSNITAERLRMDFNFDRKLTEEEISKVEEIVNEKIVEDIPVKRIEMPKEDAEKVGAEMEFGQKYPDVVSIYFVGDRNEFFSAEFCGGPHVERTGILGAGGKKFKIMKQENVGAGVKRLKAKLV